MLLAVVRTASRGPPLGACQAKEFSFMLTDPRFPKLHIVDHPLVQHKLTLMRCKETSTRDFRELLKEIAMLMSSRATFRSERHESKPRLPRATPR